MARDTWADEVKKKLDDIAQRRRALLEEEQAVKLRCNHTNSDGKSAIATIYDDDPYNGRIPYDFCSVCQR